MSQSRALFCLTGVLAMLGAVVAGLLPLLPSDAGTVQYTATFGRAGQGLDTKSDVKVRGVGVGTVKAVELAPDGRVRVRMRVEKDVRIPQSAEARIEPVSIFGPKEISLDLGASGAPYLRPGETITRTRDATDPSETAWPALRAAQAVDPQDLTTLLHTFSQGLAGQAPALRRTIANSGTVIDSAHANRAELRRLLKDLTGLGATFADRGDTIVALSRDATRLGPVLDRSDKIGDLLDQAGRLSSQVGGTLENHGENLGTVIDSTGRLTSTISADRRHIVSLIDSLGGLFEALAQIIHQPGPKGTKVASLQWPIPLDICQVIVDACR
ncbi:MCE family protein [Spirillospora sp. CA-294931]|uniref:MCE family protein n=1 Tax=Spirillospora sp. CA-294931 TaxID=3240042 RepID=UPI003D8E592C